MSPDVMFRWVKGVTGYPGMSMQGLKRFGFLSMWTMLSIKDGSSRSTEVNVVITYNRLHYMLVEGCSWSNKRVIQATLSLGTSIWMIFGECGG